MNKLGEKLLSVWWFFVLGVIGGGIVIGVLIYSSADVSVKEVEADILYERIIDCIVDNGYLNEIVLKNDFDIFETCNLNKSVFGRGSNFYFNISGNMEEENIINISEGASFENECQISIDEETKAKHFPQCSKHKINVLHEGKNIELIILTASNQNGRKITIN